MNRWVPWVVVPLASLDVLLTTWGLVHGGQELNPVAALALAGGGVLALGLLVLMKAVALFVWVRGRSKLREPDARHPYAGVLAAVFVDALAMLVSGGAVVVGLEQMGVR